VPDDAAEAFYVLEGEYVMSLDGDEHRCPAGSFVFSLRVFLTDSESAKRRAASSTSIFLR